MIAANAKGPSGSDAREVVSVRSPRRVCLPLLALSACLAARAALGAEQQDYTDDAFDGAQRAGRSIVVVVGAPWCPVCKVEDAVLSIVEHDEKTAGLVVFRVDFDSQKDALWRLDVRSPATLIGYRGDVETARTVGATRLSSIAALVATTLRRIP